MELSADNKFFRERVEMAGLTLSDRDAAILRDVWLSNPLSSLDDLLLGIRRLRDEGRLILTEGTECI